MTLRGVKGQLGVCAKAWQSGCFIIMASFYARSKDILSRVKARHIEYALGTVHGSLLRELKVV